MLLGPEGAEELCRGDDLAGVALRVVSDVDEEASDRCGELFAAYCARKLEIGAG